MSTTKQMPPLMAAPEARKYLGLSYHHFRRLVDQKLLVPAAGTHLYRRADLDRILGTEATDE